MGLEVIGSMNFSLASLCRDLYDVAPNFPVLMLLWRAQTFLHQWLWGNGVKFPPLYFCKSVEIKILILIVVLVFSFQRVLSGLQILS